MFADRITESMRRTIEVTERRRKVQAEYNETHGITPEGIKKQITDVLGSIYEKDYYTIPLDEFDEQGIQPKKLTKVMKKLKREIDDAAKKWDFERAAQLRDRLLKLEKMEVRL
jgi:excinuclease ABC subunit B